MLLNKETLDKIAHLSRLEIEPKNAERMLQDMNNILSFVEKLNELNTECIEPLTTMSQEVNSFREDVADLKLSHVEILEQAPKKDSNYFRVPKVLE